MGVLPPSSSAGRSPGPPRTLCALLRERAQEQGGRTAFTFLAHGERGQETHLTYGELDTRARALAARLQERLAPGSRALVLCPPGEDFLTALFGCFYAGVVAVPCPPPDFTLGARATRRLRAIARHSQAGGVLTTSALRRHLPPRAEAPDELDSVAWVEVEDAAMTPAGREGAASAWRPPALAPGELALLQYTSGTTGDPRGVMLSHAHVLANLEAIQQAFALTPRSVGVIWLPPHHDMGLIGGLLGSVLSFCPTVLMRPLDFLTRPARWLEAISRHGGTCSGGPDFAYELCVRRISEEERAHLDLRSWEVAFCGAEPVRAATLERFATTFAACGFRRDRFLPCYGLAEATLYVAGKPHAAPPSTEGHLVSCGTTRMDTPLRIIEPTSRAACLDGQVGEIWLSGPSVGMGYWAAPEATAETFGARCRQGTGPYLRTGDLGFVRHGELFVVGRLKDALVLRGLKYPAEEFERVVDDCHAALKPGRCVAFGIEAGGEERVAIVCEVLPAARETQPQEIIASIRAAVASAHRLAVHAVMLVRSGTLPRTSSGKIQRSECARHFREGTLQPLTTWRATVTAEAGGVAPRVPEEALLATIFAEVLGVSRVSIHDNFFEVGGHSVLAGAVVARVRQSFGVDLPVSALFEAPTVATLILVIVRLQIRRPP